MPPVEHIYFRKSSGNKLNTVKTGYKLYYNIFLSLRQAIRRWWYEYVSTSIPEADVLFMNYGYTGLNPEAKLLELHQDDLKYRYSIQLYHHLASTINWHGMNALEVGSGRGGGSSYISRYFKPKSMIGVDITAKAIDFCQRHYSIEGLSYVRGNAEALEFADSSFDAVINVESSHCYPNIEKFFREVVRVLKPNGYFLYTDIRKTSELDTWRQQLRNTGLKLLREENITPNVFRAMDLDNERKQKLINKYSPKILRRVANEFAGMKGSRCAYGAFKNGEKVYLSFVFNKKKGTEK